MNYLLDTCIISEFTRRDPNPNVIRWLDSVPETALYLSVITIGEIWKGVNRLPDSPRRAELAHWLHDGLLVRFAERVLPLDTDVALAWGELTARTAAAGRPLPAIDSLLAATALHHGLTLVTRNEGDFAGAAPVLNPWG